MVASGGCECQGHPGFFCSVRHLRNGAAIARCSQPEISWWGWRNADDEYLVTSIAKACALDPGTRATGSSLSTGNSDASEACDTDFGKVWVVLTPWGAGPHFGRIDSQGVLSEDGKMTTHRLPGSLHFGRLWGVRGL